MNEIIQILSVLSYKNRMSYPKVYEIQVINYKLLEIITAELLIHVMIFVMSQGGEEIGVTIDRVEKSNSKDDFRYNHDISHDK